MVFQDDTGKTEKPTPGRISEARDKGQVALSRELTMAGGLLVSIVLLQFTGTWLVAAFSEVLSSGLDVHPSSHHANGEVDGVMREILRCLGVVALPFIVIIMISFAATALCGYLQIGFKFASKVLAIKPERMNPIANFGRLMGFASIMRFLVSLAKLAVLVIVLTIVLNSHWERLALLHQYDDVGIGLSLIVDMAMDVFFWVAFVVALISIIDVVWQRYDHTKKLMMSKQEVEDERKRNDGDPMIKSRQKSARLELMRQRIMDSVPKADVVITNPTHFAVALKYDRTKNTAPEVVAKGADDLALRIRELARGAGVPVMEDPPLARALYRAVKVGQQIPEKFYQAVATVLGHVFRMKGKVA